MSARARGGITFIGLLFALATACSSDEAATRAVGDGCSLASDCTDPLVCAFQRCHAQCASSKDCPVPQRCVGSAYPKLGVCLLESENDCVRTSDCPDPLVCSSQRSKCEHECAGDRDCLVTQFCRQGSCVDIELVSDAAPADAGAVGEKCQYAHDCNAPLKCLGGVCAPECLIDRDCRGGETCVDAVCRVVGSGTDAAVDSSIGDSGAGDGSGGDGVATDSGGSLDSSFGFDTADAPDGLGAGCIYDSQCDPALVCRGGRCLPECITRVDCAAGLECIANHCAVATDACVPKTCLDLGLECDSATDGCGRTLYCGSCETGTCGGGGKPGKCGSGVCTPRTCADIAKNCGFIGDGCGKTISCGTCTASQICADNVCVPRSTITSCTGGGAGAGPSCGAKFDDCCATDLVPGGSFNRMNDPSLPATISTFRLDRYEVTVGRMRAFIAAGKGTQASPPAVGSGAHPLIAGSGWDASWNTKLPVDVAALKSPLSAGTYRDAPPDPYYDAMVQTNVSWYVAFAFCVWDGGRLPTEAELDYAGAAGSEQRVYPWSSPPTSTTVTRSEAICTDSLISPGPAAVGLAPLGVGRFGQYDLSGNVSEWVIDRWLLAMTPTTCIDCAYLGSGTNRVVRGAPASMNCVSGKNAVRLSKIEDDYYFGNLGFVGIRCARNP